MRMRTRNSKQLEMALAKNDSARFARDSHVIRTWFARDSHVIRTWFARDSHVIRMWFARDSHVSMWTWIPHAPGRDDLIRLIVGRSLVADICRESGGVTSEWHRWDKTVTIRFSKWFCWAFFGPESWVWKSRRSQIFWSQGPKARYI